MNRLPLGLSAPQENLQRLLIVRALFLLGTGLGLGIMYFGPAIQLPYGIMLTLISGLTLFNFLTWLYYYQRFHAVTPQACFIQLLIDLLAISALLYFSGGADNPFVSYYLVPLCLSAATLPLRYTVTLLVAALALYSSLFFFKQPLPALAPTSHQHHTASISLHTLGMGFNFLLSSVLITYFVAKMATALRQQDAQLAELREDTLRDEQLMAVATLAAGTAHELGTPLTSLKTLIGEMQQDYSHPPALQEDLALLKHQIQHCSQTLQRLHEEAGRTRHQPPPQPVRGYCEALIDHWLLLHPEVSADININPQVPQICASFDPTIEQSISNLLNNAADACPRDLVIRFDWNASELELFIEDRGPGIPEDIAQQLGQAFTSSKGEGRGLGLFLTQATLTRFGGEVRLHNRPDGGTLTHLRLPLQSAKEIQV